MSDNTSLWDRLGRTDPKHTKQFKRAGGFQGTAIKPMWSYRRMTEEFGPCGEGWGLGEPSFQVVPGENREVLVYCTASVWYGSDRKTVYGVGGDKVVSFIKANEQYKRPERWESDDEAFKKAFTDAVTNALKMIGVGADVHMGMFDDSKYVNSMAQEFAEEKQPAPKPISAAEQKRQVAEIEKDLLDCHTVQAVNACAKTWSPKMEGWSKDYRDNAIPKFKERRDEIIAAAEQDDSFPGDTDIHNVAGRRLHSMEGA